MATESTTLEVVIAGRDQFTATANKVAGSLKNLERTASAIGGHMAQGLRTGAQNLERMAMAAGALAVGGGALAVKWAGDFEAQLNTINTIAFTTPAGLKAIGDSIRTISKTTGIATEDLTSAYYDLLSAGVKAKDAQALLNDAVTLGIGGLATTQQTVDLLTTAYNAYGLTAGGAAKATDMFAQAVADGKVTAAQIAESFANVASLAKTAGVGIDQIAASYAFLTAQGVPAAEVTTEMQRALISLMKPLPALEAAQKALKVNFAQEVRTKGLVPALQELRVYADKNHIPLIELLGRIEAVKYALQTTGPNYAGFGKELRNIGDSAGMAADQMAERQQGFNYQLAVLVANVKDAGITIGSELLPVLADLSKQFSDFLKGHQGDIKSFAQGLGKAFREAVEWGKKLDWGSIGAALKGAVGFAKGVVQAFAGAPTWLQTAVVTGWGLNKLTGGAVTNIFADVAKGIGGQLLSRGSSPTNPMFVKDIGGGLPGGGPGGIGIGGAAAALGATVALQGLANSTIPNGQNPYNLPTTPSGLGPGLLDIDALAANKRKGGPNAPDFSAMSQWAAQVTGDFGRIDDAGKEFQSGLQAMTDSTMTARDALHLLGDKRWLGGLVKGIHDRSVAKFGGKGLGSAAENATYQRNILGRADSIMRHGKGSVDRLERLKQLQKDAVNATTATKNKLSADIKILAASIKKQPILVNVQSTTNVVLNQRKLVQATASTLAYGKTVSDGRVYEP